MQQMTSWRTRRRVPGWAYLLLLAAIFGAGCSGEPLGQITGKVTLQGTPVTTGSVVFENIEQGISVNAPLEPDGSYTVKTYKRNGLPPGKYQIAISPRGFNHDGETQIIIRPTTVTASPSIPKKYHTVDTSGLAKEVQVGENTFNFNLE